MTRGTDVFEAHLPPSSWTWPAIVIAMIAVNLAGMIAVIMFATGDPSVAAEPGYYAKAVGWDEQAARLRAGVRSGWSMRTRVESGRLVMRLTDAEGKPVSGAAVEVEAFAAVRSAERTRAAMIEAEPGVYATAAPELRPGLWELRYRVRLGEVDVERAVEWSTPTSGEGGGTP